MFRYYLAVIFGGTGLIALLAALAGGVPAGKAVLAARLHLRRRVSCRRGLCACHALVRAGTKNEPVCTGLEGTSF